MPLVLFGIFPILAYVMQWIILGESSYIRNYDYLDSIMALQKIMSDQEFWFSPTKFSSDIFFNSTFQE